MKNKMKLGLAAIALMGSIASTKAQKDNAVVDSTATKFELPEFKGSKQVGSYINNEGYVCHIRLDQMTETQGNLLYRIQEVMENGTQDPRIRSAWLDDQTNNSLDEVTTYFKQEGLKSISNKYLGNFEEKLKEVRDNYKN